jgi:sigma-B regulation protein RsbU (phosphoserine phosphatase)
MNIFRRIARIDSTLHGALTLGAMLAVVLVVLGAASLSLYRQLEVLAVEQRDLVRSEAALFAVTSEQFSEEANLRAFVASGAGTPYMGPNDAFERHWGQLSAVTQTLGDGGLNAAVAKLGALHREWDTQVAQPLLQKKKAATSPELETKRKLLADAINNQAKLVQQHLDARLDAAQRDLSNTIRQTLQAALLSLLFFGTFGVLFVGVRTRMLNRIRRERSIIETLQGAFRAGMEPLPGSRLGTAYISATADAAVGGDIFDTWPLDDHRGLVLVADISGKGLKAAVNTALVKYAVRTLASTTDAPDAIIASFNRLFLDTIKDPSLFVAMFVGVLDMRTMTLRYASAGHSGAFLRRAGGVEQLAVNGPLVGLDASCVYGSTVEPLKVGDLLVLATDGFTEARTSSGAIIEDAAAIRLVAEAHGDPQSCADDLIAGVRRHSGGKLADDLALVVLSIDGLPATASSAAA